jgi:SPP1 family predicted phage head-tail adaptor
MFPGRLRSRVSLQEPNPTTDAYGQRVPSWREVRKVWAQIEDLRGTEAVTAGIDAMVTDHRITIRWAPDLKPVWRVVAENGDIFEIRSIVTIGRNEGHQLGCNLRT